MRKFSDKFDDTLWYATAPEGPQTQPLEGTVKADVCIVGAGYSGLTTAMELARQGVSVVVLDRQEIGFGGSGRNAGHCTPTFSHFSLAELRKQLGAPWADRLIQRQTGANGKVTDMITRYGIDCEWEQNGYVQGALFPSHLKTLRGQRDSYNAVGARTRMLCRDEVHAVTGSSRFYGGWLHEEAGGLNALAYARGLGRAVQQEGGVIHTDTCVTGCEREGQAWVVKSERGAVRAGKVIYTTGAYTVAGWPKLDQTYRVMRVFVAATQPLSPAAQAVVLPKRTTIQDGRGDIYVYKYNRENRIVASMFPMGARGRNLNLTHQILSERLKWLHPNLREEPRWEYLWYGDLDMQRRTVPRLYGLASGVVAMTGLSGRGVPTGSMIGGILSDWAMGVAEKDLGLKLEPLSRQPLYMSLAPQIALRSYRMRDNLRAKIQNAPLPPFA